MKRLNTVRSALKTLLPLAVLVFCVFSPARSEALQVKETRWGFKDEVILGQFNPLYVLFYNDAKTKFEGFASLKKQRSGTQEGAPERKRIFLAPKSSRWIQFAPLTRNEGEEWVLRWGRGPRDFHPMPPLISGAPIWISLQGAELDIVKKKKIKAVEESFWPESVAVTDGVEAVFLDHVPRWTPTQRQALVDWLYRGGVLHLFQQSDARFPDFKGTLAPLNTEDQNVRVGAGLIVRHPKPYFQLEVSNLTAQGFKPVGPDAIIERWRRGDEIIVSRLALLHPKPKFNWVVILLLALVYLALIGPVNYLVARKTKSHLVSIGFLVLSIVVFSIFFFLLGQRGYDELTQIYKTSYARQTSDGSFDVQSWNFVFVTSSGEITFQNQNSAGHYDVPYEYIAATGYSINGQGGRFVTRIPLFSNRVFVARQQLKHGSLLGKVVKDSRTSKGLSLVVEKGPALPEKAVAWAVYKNRIYPMAVNESNSLKTEGPGQLFDAFFGVRRTRNIASSIHRVSVNPKLALMFRHVPLVLMHRFNKRRRLKQIRPPIMQDDVDILVWAPGPESWKTDNWQGAHLSQTIFHLTLPSKAR
jgi:hypothetical protein